ncbi:hypothetical protein BDV36DRAFT_76557 [Aspergillus pseudocaelatus]|uniref:Uncharacterized protein n=1 Tax=Aspergillus pseudocaelatus TaxID=1825620 RepID=A0ABQ6W3N0_9EURO|nr:hypothetical protein BDV36DRAFT_76557 [Aspergillus pseudocaelatus]
MISQRNATGCYSRIGRKFLCGKSGGPPVTLSVVAGVWLCGCKIPDDLPESQQRMICHSDWRFGCSCCSNCWPSSGPGLENSHPFPWCCSFHARFGPRPSTRFLSPTRIELEAR